MEKPPRGIRVYEYLGHFETSTPYTRTFIYSNDLKLQGFWHQVPGHFYTTSLYYLGDLPVGQISSRDTGGMIAEGDLTYFRYTFTDHLGAPILQMMGNAVFGQAEYEPYGSSYEFRVSNGEDQPLRLPGQEAIEADDGTGKVYK